MKFQELKIKIFLVFVSVFIFLIFVNSIIFFSTKQIQQKKNIKKNSNSIANRINLFISRHIQ